MNFSKLDTLINTALLELDKLKNTSLYYRSDSELMVATQKVLLKLKEEINNNSSSINNRILRAMHDIGMSSYKDFEGTPMESAINNLTELLYNEIPDYKTLTPLGNEFGKGKPFD